MIFINYRNLQSQSLNDGVTVWDDIYLCFTNIKSIWKASFSSHSSVHLQSSLFIFRVLFIFYVFYALNSFFSNGLVRELVLSLAFKKNDMHQLFFQMSILQKET